MKNRIPLVAAFLSLAGAVVASVNPMAMAQGHGITFNTGRGGKRKDRRSGSGSKAYRGGGKVYGVNGAKPVARRLYQIHSGILTRSNGLAV